MFVDSISLFASLDRSLPQDSDTLRFVQQCLGSMGLKPDSISARGQWIQIWWVFYAFISLMDPAWVPWILRILRTSGVDSGSTWLCDTHILILVLYCRGWYHPLHGNDWRSSWVVLPYYAILKCLKWNSWRDRGITWWNEGTTKTLLCYGILDPCTHIALYSYCICRYTDKMYM